MIRLGTAGVAALLALLSAGSVASAADGPRQPATAEGPVRVVHISDGDTVWVSVFGERVKVRIVGIDTPELAHFEQAEECGARLATERARQLLEGRMVWVSHDPAAGSKDRYGRTLLHIWLPDGTLFAWRMADEGLTEAYRAKNRYRTDITNAVDHARSAHRGMWASCAN